jgi:hypothetical protein
MKSLKSRIEKIKKINKYKSLIIKTNFLNF